MVHDANTISHVEYRDGVLSSRQLLQREQEPNGAPVLCVACLGMCFRFVNAVGLH